MPAAEAAAQSAFQIDVRYGADQVEVNDLLTITASVRFTPPEPVAAGMVVLDVAVPTGFAPETPTLEALAKGQPKLKRWDIAGRKVILYIEDMQPDERLAFAFQARALYPVKRPGRRLAGLRLLPPRVEGREPRRQPHRRRPSITHRAPFPGSGAQR